MSLWAIALMGTTPIGAPIVGWLGQVAGARVGLAVGGAATVLTAAAIQVLACRRDRRSGPLKRPPSEHQPVPVGG
jgi:hypothetical protein